MKTLIISIIIVLAFVQCKTKNNETKTKEIEKQSVISAEEQLCTNELIGELLDSEINYENYNDVILDIIVIEQIFYDIDQDGFEDKILLEKLYFGYEEPGDFHRIRIEYVDTCFSFYNSGGWVKIQNSANDYIRDFTPINKIKSDYIVLTANNDNLLLFAFGYVYASNPGLLSIINLSIKEPQLTLNDNYLLVKYEEHNPIFITTRYFPEDEVYQRDTLIINKNGYINFLHR